MKKILVVGESCRDVFVYCNALRLCPDAPVPVLNIIDQTENPGMAKNVQRNINSLHDNCDIITNKNWYDITKTRYVHENSNHMFFRVDSEDKIDRINIKKMKYNYDIIVISDYNKGFLTAEDIETICLNHKTVFLDTKKKLDSWANNAAFIKINDLEYKKSINNITPLLQSKIIHTLGSEGCEYNNIVYKVDKVEVKDVSGAGDTFIAGLAIKYLETQNIEESIIYANICASEVVKHRGVTTL
jgi:D-beta-D-heptose 7-phosphate kinase/D-beta-D-heptose 1-phosphate adenosyltransferase